MNCKYCGYKLGDDAAFCPSCGREVRLVADYQEFGDFLTEDTQNNTPPVKKAPVPGRGDDISREIKRQRAEQKRKKKRQARIIAGVVVAVVVVGSAFGWRMHKKYQEEHSFSYQLAQAESEFSNGRYDDAYTAIQKAIELDSASADAWLLKADILYAQKEYEKAESVLKKIISLYPDNQTAYGTLVRVYDTTRQTDKIADLFASCTDLEIREKYSAYICDVPQVSPEGGSFTDYITITISAEADAKVYYTLDGTAPGTGSAVYSEPIELSEGSTRLRAVAVNKKGIESDMVDFTYSVLYPVPDTPKIAPSSGTFTEGMDTSIQVIVPDGCKVYYAFDQKPTEKTGTLYTGPVDMPAGEHTFYAIAVNGYGKSSYASSETYSNKETQETPEDPETSDEQ